MANWTRCLHYRYAGRELLERHTLNLVPKDIFRGNGQTNCLTSVIHGRTITSKETISAHQPRDCCHSPNSTVACVPRYVIGPRYHQTTKEPLSRLDKTPSVVESELIRRDANPRNL